jgi:pimeloyl-ACP methyl ester carboxylesterase
MPKINFTTFLACIVAVCIPATSADQITDRITVSVRGQGPDVVLIPGLASSSAVWDATAKRFEGRCRLHIVQVAGFAGALPAANRQGPVIQPTVDVIDAYIKTNRLQKPKVIGHSLGGLMGIILAVQHPEDVGSLMIVDALPFYGVFFGAKDAAAIAPQAAAMRDRILGQAQDAFAQGQREIMRSFVKSSADREQATQWATASDKSVVARALYEDLTTDMRPKLDEISIPVTILYAWDPAIGIPQAASDGLYRENFGALSNKTFVRIDDSFHFIMLDQPDQFAKQADLFLK